MFCVRVLWLKKSCEAWHFCTVVFMIESVSGCFSIHVCCWSLRCAFRSTQTSSHPPRSHPSCFSALLIDKVLFQDQWFLDLNSLTTERRADRHRQRSKRAVTVLGWTERLVLCFLTSTRQHPPHNSITANRSDWLYRSSTSAQAHLYLWFSTQKLL